MIAVIRTGEPACLTQNGAQWIHELCNERVTYYQQMMQHAVTPLPVPPKKPRAKSNRYAHDEIKMALGEMFGDKCCYCEASIEHVSPRHVEHFRPASIYPALAYKWDNLLYACFKCNSIYKKDKFPLAPSEQTPTEDTINPGSRVETDLALLINPCLENPEHYLKFEDGNIVAKNNPAIGAPYRKGELTISVCGLDRPNLTRHRRRFLENIELRIETYELSIIIGDATKIHKHGGKLREHCQPKEEYAGMVRAELLKHHIDWRTL